MVCANAFELYQNQFFFFKFRVIENVLSCIVAHVFCEIKVENEEFHAPVKIFYLYGGGHQKGQTYSIISI